MEASMLNFLCKIALFTVLLLGTASARSHDQTFIQLKAHQLTQWVVAHTKYEYRPPPTIIFVSQDTLTRIYGQDTVRAMYMPDVVLLLDTFEEGEDDYILVHELVHHMQWHAGTLKYTLTECQANHEREAYLLQREYVKETGKGESPDPMFLITLNCGGW